MDKGLFMANVPLLVFNSPRLCAVLHFLGFSIFKYRAEKIKNGQYTRIHNMKNVSDVRSFV